MVDNESRPQFLNLEAAALETRSPGTKVRILLLADTGHIASVVQDHINSFVLHSRHDVSILNPIHDRPPTLKTAESIDALIVHYSIYLLGDYFLPQEWVNFVRQFQGLKVQIIQDEHRSIDRMKQRMRECGIKIVFSSLEPDNARRVYGGALLQGTRVISTLPGYIPARLRNLDTPQLSGRPLDIVYRGRILPPWLGKDALLKSLIGQQIADAAEKFGLGIDIASTEDQRIYGDDWNKFLMSGRATLGCEGGASIFDFDSAVSTSAEEFMRKHPAAGFESIWQSVLAPYEGNVVHRTITPKIFEAIATRTALVLYPGRYRGILEPIRHYIPLEPDGSNLMEVAEAMRDVEALQKLVERTWSEILPRPELQFSFYVQCIDELIAADVLRNAFVRRSICKLVFGRVRRAWNAMQDVGRTAFRSNYEAIDVKGSLPYKIWCLVPERIRRRIRP